MHVSLRTAAAIAALAALAGVAIAGLNRPGSARGEPPKPAPRIAWQPCDDPDFRRLDCGTLRVPIDASAPWTGTTELKLVRRRADDRSRRIGTMLLNNGPGSSSIEQLRFALGFGLANLGGALTKRFDVVAVDPRGVGHSSPLDCRVPLKAPGITHFPATEAQFEALKTHNRALAANCRALSGPLVDHVDLTTTARDFERVRIALGERQVSWYGITYSTLLGRTYARLYPGRVRSMVLDTALNDGLPMVERLASEMEAAEDSFNRFAAWCATANDCALQAPKVGADYDELVQRANRSPIPIGTTGRAMTGEDIQKATQGWLVERSVTWSWLADALARARDGDAATLEVDPDKTLDWKQAQLQACLDTPRAATTWEQFAELVTMARQISPHLGGAVQSWTNTAGCVGWPRPAKPIDTSSPVAGAPPAVILQSTGHSLAPYKSAFGLADQLAGSRVVTYAPGDEYTMYLISACSRALVDRYLVERKLPGPGEVCTS